MGIEWHIGCLKCKRQIWLGSQKPYKWKGFQIGNENAKRFLSLHASCGSKENGNFLLTNDGTTKIPWEDDAESIEWAEDILSRTFCYDSWRNEDIICAHCSEKLDVDEESRLQKGNLMKNQFLWYCNEACFHNYVEFYREERGRVIYDSTNDKIQAFETSLEVTCTICNTSLSIDNQEDEIGNIKDFEYLALFMGEHLGHDHLLRVSLGKNSSIGRGTKSDKDWKE